MPYRLFIISARAAELMQDVYVPRYGISQAAWRVVAVLGRRPGLSARQLQQATGLDQFSVSRAIRQLSELGYAERSTAERDKRRADVRLSAAGIAVFEYLSRVGLQIEDRIVSGMSEERRKLLNELISEIDRSSNHLLTSGRDRLVL